MNKTETIKNIILNARDKNRFVSLDFIKKNGELRHMTLGRSKKLEDSVKGTQADRTEARKWTLNANGMLVVEELTSDHKAQWRTVTLDSVKRIKSDGQELTFD